MPKLLTRRSAVASTAALLVGAGSDRSVAHARAQSALPKGPIRLVVGYSAGGGADVLARLLAQKLGERTGLTFVIENKPGASGVIATEMVTKAPADGTTLILANMASTIMAKLTFPKLPYDPQKDLAPISLVCTFQSALAVTPSIPVTDMTQFAAWAKANPDKTNFGVPAVGGNAHFFGLMLGKGLGVDMQVVPYKGTAPMLSDLSGGQLYVGISGVADFMAAHNAGKIRMLATSGTDRAQATPSLPTFIQSGFPGLSGEGWFGVYGPAGMPTTIVDAWSAEIQAVMKQPDIRERLVMLAMDPRGSTPAQLAEFDENERKRWGPVVAASGYKVE